MDQEILNELRTMASFPSIQPPHIGYLVFRFDSRARGMTLISVRKSPKAHGQTKLIEGNFKRGDAVVVIDDVVTRGESTIAAINAIEKEGGTVAFVVVLLDRQEGGREKIEAMGHPVVALFTKKDLLGDDVESHQPAGFAVA